MEKFLPNIEKLMEVSIGGDGEMEFTLDTWYKYIEHPQINRFAVIKTSENTAGSACLYRRGNNLIFRIGYVAGGKAITGVQCDHIVVITDDSITISDYPGYIKWGKMRELLLRSGWIADRDHYVLVNKDWVLDILRKQREGCCERKLY